jgi:hypothetical protein
VFDTLYLKEPKSRFDFDFFVSYGIGLNNRYSTNNLALENQVNSLNVAQHNYWIISSGFNVNFHINQWFIRTGLSYCQYNSKFFYSTALKNIVSKTLKTPTVVDQYVELPDSNWVSVVDTVITSVNDTTFGTSTQNFSNRLNYVQIPLCVGYNYSFDKHWCLFISGGIITGILINQKGKTYSAQNEVININRQNLNSCVFSFTGSLGISYKPAGNFSFFARLEYQTNLSNMYKRATSISYKQAYLFTALGIRYNF